MQAAELIASAVRTKPDLVLCAATGSTPTRCYELLAERAKGEPGLFDSLRCVAAGSRHPAWIARSR